MNEEMEKEINECLDILTDKSCNYRKTALRLNDLLEKSGAIEKWITYLLDKENWNDGKRKGYGLLESPINKI